MMSTILDLVNSMMSIRVVLVFLVICSIDGILASDEDGALGSFPLWLLIVLIIISIIIFLSCLRFLAKFFVSSEEKDKKRIKALAQSRINKSLVTNGGAWNLDDKISPKETSRDANPSSVYVVQPPASRPPPPTSQHHQHPQKHPRIHKPVYEQPSLSSFYAEDSSMSIPQPSSFPANSKDTL